MAEKMEAICAVVKDVEEKGYTNNTIKIWVRDLKSVIYDIDDLFDEVAFDAKLRKANEGRLCSQLRYYVSPFNPIISRFRLSHKIKDLREKLDNIVAKKNEFGLSERPVERASDEIMNPSDRYAYVNRARIAGREEAKKDVLDKVYSVSDATQVSVLPIVGIGGIGKTALAKLVYAHVQNFDLKLWACVSDKFQIGKIIEDIVKDGTSDKTLNQDLSTSVKKLHGLLRGKKYFLVLDDVWVENISMWNELKDLLAVGKEGSVILITTREEKVASITRANYTKSYNLESLPESVCWSIFKGLAFQEGEETKYPHLVEIGKSIVAKCCGIPLVTTLGNMLSGGEGLQGMGTN
ncbi:putative disease resistance protein RGA3 [Bienertia sinuspersici]